MDLKADRLVTLARLGQLSEANISRALHNANVKVALKELVREGRVTRVVVKEFDKQGGEPARTGLFGGVGTMIRHRARYSICMPSA